MGVSKTRDTRVDPNFAIPFGLVDVRQQNQEEEEVYYDESTIAPEVRSTIPMPPSSYDIVEQRVRIGADGRSVVDIYIDFPDVLGIDNIEVNISPA